MFCDNLEWWDGGVGREAQDRRDVYTYGWFMLLYGRNQQKISHPVDVFVQDEIVTQNLQK